MKHIVSRDNAHFKELKRLCQSGRERRKQGRVVLDGMHLVEGYLAHCGVLDEVVVSESGALRGEIAAFLANAERTGRAWPLSVLADALFAELASVDTPSGILAIAAQPRGVGQVDARADAVLLDAIQDPGNLGSILRSAAAAGFGQVLLSPDCAAAWSPKTLRAAMGAHFLLDIHEGVDLPAFLETLETYRGTAVLTALDASTDVFALDLRQPLAWVFGNEGQGVSDAVAQRTPLHVRIPMPGATESLNVAAAAAVCLFETVRQRR